MPIIAKSSGDGTTFTPAPAGVHQAVCVDVIDKGMVPGFEKKLQHKIAIVWQIDERRDDGKRFLLYRRYTLSLNEKATLRKDLESWRGRAFTRDEEMGFDVETIKGVNCLVNVQHNVSGDKTYANVVAVMPLAKGMAHMSAEDYERNESDSHDSDDTKAAPQPEPEAIDADSIPF